MRLGTLARKISITPSKLTAFLESQNIDLNSGTNTKLSEEEIDIVLAHFDASLTTEEPKEKIVETETSETEEIVEAPTKTENSEALVIEEKIEEPVIASSDAESTAEVSESFAEIALPHELEDTKDETPQKSQEQKEETIEEEYIPQIPDDLDPEIESYVERLAYDENVKVIKPAKVKLQGLKVKGKIDLPEPKVKEEVSEEVKKEEKKPYDPDEIITTTGPKRERRRKPKNYKGKKFNKNYNPIEAERKKKAWEEKKKKEREEKRKKKAKELHYKKTVKVASSTSSNKKKTKKAAPKKKQELQTTGNVFQRFWRWMNT